MKIIPYYNLSKTAASYVTSTNNTLLNDNFSPVNVFGMQRYLYIIIYIDFLLIISLYIQKYLVFQIYIYQKLVDEYKFNYYINI